MKESFLFCYSWRLCLKWYKDGFAGMKVDRFKMLKWVFIPLQPTELRNLLFRMLSQKSMRCKFRYNFKSIMNPKSKQILRDIKKWKTEKILNLSRDTNTIQGRCVNIWCEQYTFIMYHINNDSQQTDCAIQSISLK